MKEVQERRGFSIFSLLMIVLTFGLALFAFRRMKELSDPEKLSLKDVFGSAGEVAKSSVKKVQSAKVISKKVGGKKSVSRAKRVVEKKKVPVSAGDGINRKSALLKLIKSLRNADMSEIGKRFPKVTDRTLRRDLNALIKSGNIKKEGRTKNSTYVFVK